jgi:acetyl esterase
MTPHDRARDNAVHSDLFFGLNHEERTSLRAIGTTWNDDIPAHRDQVLAIYGARARHASKENVRVTREIAYGSDPRQCLDIFQPIGRTGRQPVIVFVHGGAFTRGKKSINGEIYDNVLHWFANQGFVGVNVEYRLAPQYGFPAGAEDVASAVSWIETHIADFGGRPDCLVLIGHSAGGSHVATYLLDPNVDLSPSSAIVGSVLISGRLRADRLPDNPNAANVAAYYGEDEMSLQRRSPTEYAHRCNVPVMVVVAEFENRHLDRYGAEFAEAVAKTSLHASRFLRLAAHNHTSIVAHFNTGEETLGWAIFDFLQSIPTFGSDM